MSLNFSNSAGSNWGLPVETQSTDYSTIPLSSGQPINFVDVPRSDGFSFTGFLENTAKTVENLSNTFGKVYQLQSNVESQKFNREFEAAKLDIQRSQQLGSLDVQKASIDANKQIALLQAQRAVKDAQVQVAGGSAGYVKQTANILSSPMVSLVGVAVVGYVLMTRGSK